MRSQHKYIHVQNFSLLVQKMKYPRSFLCIHALTTFVHPANQKKTPLISRPKIKTWGYPRQSAVLMCTRLHDILGKLVPDILYLLHPCSRPASMQSCHGVAYLQSDLHGRRKCKRIVGNNPCLCRYPYHNFLPRHDISG
jgi:hypothetical protein